jgi:hypothetical protein
MKTKLSVIVAVIVIFFSSIAVFTTQKAEAYEAADTCRMYVPAYQDCMWHPVNCACDIIVTPQEN